ncbi:MAG: MAPEG family protein [Pseudomonadota bacterium]
MEFPIVTATAAGAIIILQQILMLSTGTHRFKTNIGVGVAEDRHLERKMRRHGNLAENSAIYLLVLAFAELYNSGSTAITVFAVLFVVSRAAHALGFMSLAGSHVAEGSKLFPTMRAIGAFGTALGGIALGAYVLLTLFKIL